MEEKRALAPERDEYNIVFDKEKRIAPSGMELEYFFLSLGQAFLSYFPFMAVMFSFLFSFLSALAREKSSRKRARQRKVKKIIKDNACREKKKRRILSLAYLLTPLGSLLLRFSHPFTAELPSSRNLFSFLFRF